MGGLATSAQTASPELQKRNSQADARRVVLDVAVRGQAGAAISKLRADDLVVRDNNRVIAARELAVNDERAEVQILFVLDAVNSSQAELTRSEDALEGVLKSQGVRLAWPVTVLIVSDTDGTKKGESDADTKALHGRQLFVHRIAASTDSSNISKQLQDYDHGLRRFDDAQTGPTQGERVKLSLEALSFIANAETSVAGPKIVLWMAPGWPLLAESDAKSSEQLFDSVIYFSNLIRGARIILYAINPQGMTTRDLASEGPAVLSEAGRGPLGASSSIHASSATGPDYYKQYLKGARTAKQANPNSLALQVLAFQSGGLVLQQNNDMEALIRRCLEDVKGLYSVSYEAEPPAGKDPYHELSVRLVRDRQELGTRTGFYLR